MKTKYFFLAAIGAITLASCSNDEFVGDTSPTLGANGGDGSIQFTYYVPNATRADIYGKSAADLLGNNFYVEGTKGTQPETSPTTTVVFDNYLVHYGVNTAGTTESNTANWEYVGINQGASPKLPEDYERVKLSSINGAQTIKYWDYSAPQYDFIAFSTGTFKAVTGKTLADIGSNEISVTPIATGTTLSSNAYSFVLQSKDALSNTFITDIQEVAPENYGKEVTLRFKNLGSKVRIALYETVPGYSVKDVVFYKEDGYGITGAQTTAVQGGALISNADPGLPIKANIQVYYPHIGTDYESPKAQDYNVATATVTNTLPVDADEYESFTTFGPLTAQLKAKERDEATGGTVYLGRSLPDASFAGSEAAQFYQTVFPVSTSAPLTLRVDYTLVPIDGAAETIIVKGARAVVPSTYTVWKPNYAYTYIFKISDNTNGWTGTTSQPNGLFPITFDAVVAEATDATAEQKTITTVSTPSITTYQQKHDISKNEYSKATEKNIYVQVMDNSATISVLVDDLDETTPSPESTNRSLLYAVTPTGKTYASEPDGFSTGGYYLDAACTSVATSFNSSTPYYKLSSEADVMDALQNRTTALGVANVTGRNGVTLTNNVNITTEDAGAGTGKFRIQNGVDDNPIEVNKGEAAMITIGSLTAGTYAYVYDYSSAVKAATIIYQPITHGEVTLENGKTYVLLSEINGIAYESNKTAADEEVSNLYLYFSKTTNGSGTPTYSFVSVDGKTKLPADLLKVTKSTYLHTSTGSSAVTADDFVFDTYERNEGKYAVKIIRVVN